MKQKINDLTQGNLFHKILIFSIPLILSNLLQVLFNMADLAVIGRFSGPISLGAVGSTSTLVMMFSGFLIGLSGWMLSLLKTKPELLPKAALYLRIYYLGMPALAEIIYYRYVYKRKIYTI